MGQFPRQPGFLCFFFLLCVGIFVVGGGGDGNAGFGLGFCECLFGVSSLLLHHLG